MALPVPEPTNSTSALARIGGKKSDLAYEALKREIVLRNYEPGKQMLEQTLAKQLECSQSTVREALINLAKDGLVVRTGYNGTFVTDTSLHEAAAMVRMRLMIERSVARRLSTLAETMDRAQVEQIFHAMEATHADGDLYRSSELDRKFHAHLCEMAGMSLLSPMLQRCALHMHRYTLSNVEVPREFFQEGGVGAEHRALFKTLGKGTAEEAEDAIVQHLAFVLQRWSPSLFEEVGADQFKSFVS